MTLLDPTIDNLKYEMQDENRPTARVKVVGVGGGGSNAVAHMMEAGLADVDFYILNTDALALRASPVPNKLAIGCKVTSGRGAGADPETGRQAALEDTERIVEILQGADLVFVTAGLGSGTGTGAAPVVASIAKELNALTVAVVTTPFAFEGARRLRQAEQGIEKLAENVDTVIAIPNERLLALAPRGTSILEAFRLGHEFLRQTVQDIVEIVTTPGFINRDFSDIRTTLFGMGRAVLGTASARGENAAQEAAQAAISCPLIEQSGIRGARNVLLNVTGSSRLGLHEVNDACQLIRAATGVEDVQLNFGLVLNENMGEAVKVTVIATGFVTGFQAAAIAAPVLPSGESGWLSEAPAEPVAAQPEPEGAVLPEPAPEPIPEPESLSATLPEPEPEPEDLDDLDTPAYLRQRRVLR
ncbi:MAG TPA: cell division protein FtsZ [Bryobacteraceae bacterium]